MVKVINPTASCTTQITHKFILGVHREVCPDKLLGEQTRRLLRACASEYLDQIFESACEMCLFSGMGLLQPKHLQMAVRLEESRAEAVREFVRAIKESAGAEEGDSLQALLLLDEETVPEVVKNLSLRRRGGKNGKPTDRRPAGSRRRRRGRAAKRPTPSERAQSASSESSDSSGSSTSDEDLPVEEPIPRSSTSACSQPSTS